MKKTIKTIISLVLVLLLVASTAFAASDSFDFNDYTSSDEKLKTLPANGSYGVWDIYPSSSQSETGPPFGVAPVLTDRGTSLKLIVPDNNSRTSTYNLFLRYTCNTTVTDGIVVKAGIYMPDHVVNRAIQFRQNGGSWFTLFRAEKNNGQLSIFGSNVKDSSGQYCYLALNTWYDLTLKYNVKSGYYNVCVEGGGKKYTKEGTNTSSVSGIDQITFGYTSSSKVATSVIFDDIQISAANDVHPSFEFYEKFDDFSSASDGQTPPVGFNLTGGVPSVSGVWSDSGSLIMKTSGSDCLDLTKTLSPSLWGRYMISFDMTAKDDNAVRSIKLGDDTVFSSDNLDLVSDEKYSVSVLADSMSQKAKVKICDSAGSSQSFDANLSSAVVSAVSICTSGGGNLSETLIDNFNIGTVYNFDAPDLSYVYDKASDSLAAQITASFKNKLLSVTDVTVNSEATDCSISGSNAVITSCSLAYGSTVELSLTACDVFGNNLSFSKSFVLPHKITAGAIEINSDSSGAKASVSASSNNGDTNPAVLAAYVVGSDGRKKAFVTEPIEIKPQSQSFTLSAPYDDGDSVQFFLWDSLTALNSITAAASIGEGLKPVIDSTVTDRHITADTDTGIITVYGYDITDKNTLVAVLATDITPQTITKEEDIAFVKEFSTSLAKDVFSFCLDGESGNYGIWVKRPDGEEFVPNAFNFISETEKNSVLAKLNAQTPDFDDIIRNDDFVLEIDKSLYLALDSSGASAVRSALLVARLQQDGAEFNALSQFRSAYNAAVAVQSLCAETDPEDIEALLTAFEGSLQWQKSPAYSYYKDFTAEQNLSVFKAVASKSDYQNISDITAHLSELTALTVIDTCTINQDIAYILEHLLNADMSTYRGLSTSGQESVLSSLKSKSPFASASAAVSFFGTKALELSVQKSSGGSGASSSSSSNINFSVSTSDEVLAPPEVPEVKAAFSDLGNHSWAVEAIEYLSAKGIVNGKGGGIFAPGDLVTREEFVKMLVSAYGRLDASAQVNFADVDTDSWYYTYVASAVNAGIVQGMSSEIFGTGTYITRQDIAVMAARARGADADDAELPFADTELIMPYAKDSVACLYNLGIISGKGNNVFAPLDNATRAEAAKIIYYLIK